MAEKRTIELEIQDNSKSLKSQYKEAVAELQKMSAQYGETSAQAVKAAKAAADLKDQIAFSKDLVDAFNPDAKFNALTKSVGGVLDGFQAFEGALGLIGVQGDQVQETILKVQSAMALSQGIQGVFEAKDAFMQLGTVMKSTAVGQALLTAATAAYTFVTTATTTAVKLFRIALISTGIGALVVGVGLLVANFDKVVGVVKSVVGWFGGLSGTMKMILSVIFPFIGAIRLVVAGLEALGIIDNEQEKIKKKNHENDIKRAEATIKKQEEQRKAREKAFTNEQNNYDRAIKLAQAEGKSVYELTKAKLISSIKNQEAKKREIAQELQYMRLLAEQTKFIDEISGGALTARVDELDKLLAESANELENQKNDLKILEIEKNKPASGTGGGASSSSEAKSRLDLARQNRDKEIELMAEGYDKQVTLAKEKAKREKEDLAESIKGKIYDQEQYAKQQQLIDDNLKKDLRKLDIQFNSEKLKTLEGGIEFMSTLRGKDLDAEIEASAKRLEIAKEEAEKKKQLEEEVSKAKFKIAKDGLQLVSNITELFGTQNKKRAKAAFQVDKAAKLASATIAGYEGTMEAYKTGQKSPITAVFPAYPYVQAGLAAAFAATTIAKIAQSKFESGGASGGGGGAAGGGASGGGITPQFNTVGNNGINQLAQLQQQPVQAYVVSGEVTSAQALDRNRVQNSTL